MKSKLTKFFCLESNFCSKCFFSWSRTVYASIRCVFSLTSFVSSDLYASIFFCKEVELLLFSKFQSNILFTHTLAARQKILQSRSPHTIVSLLKVWTAKKYSTANYFTIDSYHHAILPTKGSSMKMMGTPNFCP